MSLKSRVKKIEGKKGGNRGLEPAAIYLCELKPGQNEKSEPRLAYIMKGPSAGGQVSRREGETPEDFEARVTSVVEGQE